jgi:hypothetical protein
MDPTHVHDTHSGASFWVGLALMLFSSALAFLSTLSFQDLVHSLDLNQIPATRFARLALLANWGVPFAGLALTGYLALSAH